ncbi:MAG: DUF4159 domain-containing protein, partial [Pirellulaceae bacterium]
MQRRWRVVVALAVGISLMGAAVGMAQWRRSWRNIDRTGATIDRNGVPEWEVVPEFKNDLFTFVRVEYDEGGMRRRGGGWTTDYPDSDLNFSFRLQQLTALKVDPHPKIVRLTDEELFDYPFVYLIEPGDMYLSDEEVVALRRYLLNGGFMMVDDFWGEYEWMNLYDQVKRVFPDREPQELPLEHEVFHCVYDLPEKPQIPSIHAWASGYATERSDAPEAYYKGVFDDKGRMMMIICHNTDLGDGWEREGEDPEYFREFSEKRSYPLGINII